MKREFLCFLASSNCADTQDSSILCYVCFGEEETLEGVRLGREDNFGVKNSDYMIIH